MFKKAYFIEMNTFFKQRVFWYALLFFGGGISLLDVIGYLVAKTMPLRSANVLIQEFIWPSSLVNAVQLTDAHALGGLLLVTLIGLISARGFAWRTLHLWLSRGVPRSTLFVARCLTILLLILIFICIILIVSGITSGVITLISTKSLNIQPNDIKILFLNVLVIYCGLLPYIALTLMLVMISHNSVFSIFISLTFIFFVEKTIYPIFTYLGGVNAQIVQYLPIGLEQTLQIAIGGGTAKPQVVYPSPFLAVVIIGVYVIIFGIIGLWGFLYQDLTS